MGLQRPTTLYSWGERNITRVMQAAGITRLVGVAVGGFVADPDDGLLLTAVVKPLIGRILKHPYADMMRVEAETRRARSNGPSSGLPGSPTALGRYRTVVGGTGNVPGGLRISRADVANFMVTQLESPHTFRKAVGIAY